MGTKRTIAIVGATERNGAALVNQFAFVPYRLLLVSQDIDQLSQLQNSIAEKNPAAEIDTIECVKDGCWEADIIILADAADKQKEAIERMKEVATQKIVVSFLNKESQKVDLTLFLPYSRLVTVSQTPDQKKVFISGNNDDANKEIFSIFIDAGYQALISGDSLIN